MCTTLLEMSMAERESTVDSSLVYVNQGFNLLEELIRHRFTDDKRLAELLVIRCEEFVYGLIILERLTLWSEEVHDRFQAVIDEQLGIIMNGFASLKRMRASITNVLAKTTRRDPGFEVDPDFLSLKLNLKVYVHCTLPGVKLLKC